MPHPTLTVGRVFGDIRISSAFGDETHERAAAAVESREFRRKLEARFAQLLAEFPALAAAEARLVLTAPQ